MSYTLATLPAPLLQRFLLTYVLKGSADSHRKALRREFTKAKEGTLESASRNKKLPKAKVVSQAKITNVPIVWATDNYVANGFNFERPVWDTAKRSTVTLFGGVKDPWETFEVTATDIGGDLLRALELIVPRKDKAQEVQKLRTKEKAEVFTPSWVCNLQNNLVDDSAIRESAFNILSEDKKSWKPTSEPVFNNLQEAVEYIAAPRLEITCGEAPYLVSRYDTVTGEDIAVRDSDGRFQRIGILDRKLRVTAEVADDYESWELLALAALRATYGYEWQGDSLLLARLNLLNTFLDYRADFVGSLSKKARKIAGKKPSQKVLLEVADIISWNLWQMDGIKMVSPLSCKEDCLRCDKGRLKDPIQKHWGHDGQLPLLSFRDKVFPFEDMVFFRSSEKQMLPLTRKKARKEPEAESEEEEIYEAPKLIDMPNLFDMLQ